MHSVSSSILSSQWEYARVIMESIKDFCKGRSFIACKTVSHVIPVLYIWTLANINVDSQQEDVLIMSSLTEYFVSPGRERLLNGTLFFDNINNIGPSENLWDKPDGTPRWHSKLYRVLSKGQEQDLLSRDNVRRNENSNQMTWSRSSEPEQWEMFEGDSRTSRVQNKTDDNDKLMKINLPMREEWRIVRNFSSSHTCIDYVRFWSFHLCRPLDWPWIINSNYKRLCGE